MAVRNIVVRLKAEVNDFNRQMAQAGKSTDKAAADFDKNGQKIQTTAGRMVRSAEVNSAQWQTAGASITAFGVAGAAALTLTAKAAIDWDSAWTGVLKTVDGTTAQMDALEGSLRDMSLVLPASSTEIAAVAEAAGQLGIGVDDVASFTRVMIDLGETTNLTADEAATSLARISNIMGTSADDVDRMGAVIVDLGNNSATTEAEIVGLATRLAAAGNQAGLSESDIFAFASTLTSVGVEAEAGGSALSKVFTSIGDATRDGGAKLETFAKVAGVSSADFQKAFSEDAAGAISMFIDGMGKLAESGGSTTQVFSDLELTDQRLKTAILSTSSASGLLNEQLAIGNKAWEENTALTTEAEKRYDTAAAKLQLAKNAINDAAITIGQDFLPVLADMAGALANVAGVIGGLPDPVRKIGTGFATTATAVALTGGAFLLLVPKILATRQAMETLNISARKLGKGGASIAAVTALAVGLDYMYQAAKHAGDGWREMVATIQSESAGNTRGDIEDTVTALEHLRDGIEETRSVGDSGFSNSVVGKVVDNWKNLGVDQGIVAANDAIVDSNVRAINAIDNAQAVVSQGDWAANFADLGKNIKPTVQQLQDLAELNGIDLTSAPDTNAAKSATAELMALAAANSYSATQADIATQATEAETEALQAWMEAASAADGAFIDIQGAYQSIIDKNTALAQSTANATESSTDSWEDFYDGQKVSASDYIAQLQAQVDAQTDWEANMLTIAGRVASDMPAEMQDAATEMISELNALGPAGAAQVALLADLSDAEFAKVVDLYGQKGTEATDEFAAALLAAQTPVVDVDVDTDAADAKYANFIAKLGMPVVIDVLPQFGGGSDISGQSRANLFTSNIPKHARGAIATGPQVGIWGEAGAEALVPLNRPLSQVDPSVRALSAFAQGLPQYADGGVFAPSGGPSVVTVPVQSRVEQNSPINIGTLVTNDLNSFKREAQLQHRRRAAGGRR